MKRKISTAAFALLFLTLTAFGYDRTKPSTKEIAIEGNYQKITVGANIKLVLVPSDKKNAVTVAGDESRINDITVKVNKNGMSISSKRDVKRGSIIVFVPATDLSYINLESGASVSGEGYLKFSNLTVFVNVDSRMELEAIGKINIKQADDCEFIYEKKETAKVVYLNQ